MQEIPKPETTPPLTPEQQAVGELSQSAIAAFNAHGVEINDLSKSRTLHVSGLFLTVRQNEDGESEFSCWSAWHSDTDKGERVYGQWIKGGSEILADTSDDWRDRTPLDEDGLAKLKELIDTSFPVPDRQETQEARMNILSRFLAKAAMLRSEDD